MLQTAPTMRIMQPGHHERVQSLKRAVKSLAMIAFVAFLGLIDGAILFGYYLEPRTKPPVIDGLAHTRDGLPIFATAGAFFGSIGGFALGIYAARQLWWQSGAGPAGLRFSMRSLLVTITLI